MERRMGGRSAHVPLRIGNARFMAEPEGDGNLDDRDNAE